MCLIHSLDLTYTLSLLGEHSGSSDRWKVNRSLALDGTSRTLIETYDIA